MRKHFAKGAVVQLVRIPACHAGGRGFESRPLRQHKDESLYSNVEAFFVLRKKELSLSTIHGLRDICASMHFVV